MLNNSKIWTQAFALTGALLGSSLSGSAFGMDNLLTVTEGAYTLPATSQAVLTLKSTADFDVICNVQVVGVIRGHDPISGSELTGRQASDSVIGFVLKAGRKQDRTFDFTSAVNRMREVWKDPKSILVEVDQFSLVSQCQKTDGSSSDGATPICSGSGSDPDGDGWGWENNASCKTNGGGRPTPPAPTPAPGPTPVCAYSGSDPDGDGWGWENNASCKMPPHAETPPPTDWHIPQGPELEASCAWNQWLSPTYNSCFNKSGGCYQYNGTDSSTCNTGNDSMQCDWNSSNDTCYEAHSGSSNNQWWSNIYKKYYPKNGSCSQYNYTNKWTCNSSEDNMQCDWNDRSNTCYSSH